MNEYVVFTPDNPNLYSLNHTARLVLAFCDGRLGSALEKAYSAAFDSLVPAREARAELRAAIQDLERKGIVFCTRPLQQRASKTIATAQEGIENGWKNKIDA